MSKNEPLQPTRKSMKWAQQRKIKAGSEQCPKTRLPSGRTAPLPPTNKPQSRLQGNLFCISNTSGHDWNEVGPDGRKFSESHPDLKCVQFKYLWRSGKGKGDVPFSQSEFLPPIFRTSQEKANSNVRQIEILHLSLLKILKSLTGEVAWHNPHATFFSHVKWKHVDFTYIKCKHWMRNMHISWCSRSPVSESHLSIQDKPSNISSFIRLLSILRQHINFHFVCLRFPARSPRKLRPLFYFQISNCEWRKHVWCNKLEKRFFWNPPSSDLASTLARSLTSLFCPVAAHQEQKGTNT